MSIKQTESDLLEAVSVLRETVAVLNAMLPKLETKIDHIAEQVNTLQFQFIKNEEGRKTTCPNNKQIGAIDRRLNQIEDAPGKLALKIVIGLLGLIGASIGAFSTETGRSILIKILGG